jgi:hypothetical protein
MKKTQLKRLSSSPTLKMKKAGAADAAHDFAFHHGFQIEPEDPMLQNADWMITVVNLFDEAGE